MFLDPTKNQEAIERGCYRDIPKCIFDILLDNDTMAAGS